MHVGCAGFAVDNNPHDVALLPPPWPARCADDPLGALKARLLQRSDVAPASAEAQQQQQGAAAAWWGADADAAPLPVRSGADAAALLATLRVMHAAPEDLTADAAAQAAAGSLPPLDATRPLSSRNEAAARTSLRSAARAALSRYPSTLAQTERALQLQQLDEPGAGRTAAALRVRAGEQRALQALAAAADGDATGGSIPGSARKRDTDAARSALRSASLL
jgi:hypothetical protein